MDGLRRPPLALLASLLVVAAWMGALLEWDAAWRNVSVQIGIAAAARF